MKKQNKFYRFAKTSIIGGFVVVLPLSILVFIFKWLFSIISNNLEPITNRIIGNEQSFRFVVDIAVILMLIFACFFIGLFVKTKVGKWIYASIETSLFAKIPGYKMIKETISQLLSKDRGAAFSAVALCRIFGNDTRVTAFVTDRHDNGMFTVFVPTGPNPTSGNIYHLKPEYVEVLDISTEETMRSIISCGAGSKPMIEQLQRIQALDEEIKNSNSPAITYPEVPK